MNRFGKKSNPAKVHDASETQFWNLGTGAVAPSQPRFGIWALLPAVGWRRLDARLIDYSHFHVTVGWIGPNDVVEEGRKRGLWSQEKNPGLQHFLKKGLSKHFSPQQVVAWNNNYRFKWVETRHYWFPWTSPLGVETSFLGRGSQENFLGKSPTGHENWGSHTKPEKVQVQSVFWLNQTPERTSQVWHRCVSSGKTP